MACTFRARVNQLWSIWYTISMALLQAYLLYLGFERYRLYVEMKWPHGTYPFLWLNVYVILYSICVPGLLLFMATGIFKSGNIAGDNDRLGARIDRIIEINRSFDTYKKGSCSPLRRMKSLWQYAPPLPQLIHLLMALLQLFAQQVMLSQLYRYGFINSGDFLNTELDFAYQRARQLAINLPVLDNKLHGFRISSQDLNGTPIGPNLLPILMHARLFGIPLEFVNLLIALFVYTCAYSAIFWHTNKPFSFIFSLHLLIFSVTVIWSYLGFTVLHRIQETNYASVRPIGLGQYLISSQPFKIYHPSGIIATYITTIILISIAPSALYMYGYNKYFINMSYVRQKSVSRSQTNSMNRPQKEYSEYHSRSLSKMPQSRLCCDGYAPHIIAIILLVLIVIAKAPTIYAHMLIYQHEEKALLLSCIIIDIVYLFAWIILWLILTLKRDWNFKVVHQVHEIIALQNGPQTMIAIPAQILEKKPSELKNALILMHGDQMYLTDDTVTKQSILRQTQKNGLVPGGESVYWLKGNMAYLPQSPTARKVPLGESVKDTPEMSRLLCGPAVRRRSGDENSSPTAAYHTIVRTVQPQMSHVPQKHRTKLNPSNYTTETGTSTDIVTPGNTFGTLQRIQRGDYTSGDGRQGPQNSQRPSLENSINGGNENITLKGTPLFTQQQQETYASIHKNRTGQSETVTTQRLGLNDEEALNNGFGGIGPSYGTYTTYSRPQTRALQNQQLMQQAAVQAAQVVQGGRNIALMYGKAQTSMSQQMISENETLSPTLAVRSSPIAENRIGMRTSASSREQLPYQKTSNLKLSSFNPVAPVTDSHKLINIQQQHQQSISGAATIGESWSQQRRATRICQSSESPWTNGASYDKNSSAASNIQQEQCFTPSSTLTSQGSTSNYSSQQAGTPGSPSLQYTRSVGRFIGGSSATMGASSLYGNLGDDYGTSTSKLESSDRDRTLKAQQQQKTLRQTIATGSTSVRHQIKTSMGGSRQDDSANHSLTSSNESTENPRSNTQKNRIIDSADYVTSIV